MRPKHFSWFPINRNDKSRMFNNRISWRDILPVKNLWLWCDIWNRKTVWFNTSQNRVQTWMKTPFVFYSTQFYSFVVQCFVLIYTKYIALFSFLIVLYWFSVFISKLQLLKATYSMDIKTTNNKAIFKKSGRHGTITIV